MSTGSVNTTHQSTLTPNQYRKSVVGLIKQAREALISGQNTQVVYEENGVAITMALIEVMGTPYRFFGIEKCKQDAIPQAKRRQFFENARGAIAKEMGLPQAAKGVQVIGDSACFGEHESKAAYRYSTQFLNENVKDNVLLYGFTGNHRFTPNVKEDEKNLHAKLLDDMYKTPVHELDKFQQDRDHHRLDVNQIVNQWVRKHPEKAKNILANVVDLHSPMAIESWGCDCSHLVTNFYLVYDKNAPSVTFGGDILSSDFMTNVLLNLEGGIQSLAQTANVSSSDASAKIVSVDNLRGTGNDGCHIKRENRFGTFYSNAEMIKYLLHKSKTETVNDENVSSTLLQYRNLNGVVRHPANPERHDYATKAALLDTAMSNLVESGTWKKIVRNNQLEMLTYDPTHLYVEEPPVDIIINAFESRRAQRDHLKTDFKEEMADNLVKAKIHP